MVSCHKEKTDGQAVPQHPGMHALHFSVFASPPAVKSDKRSASRKRLSQLPEAAENMQGRMMYIIRCVHIKMGSADICGKLT